MFGSRVTDVVEYHHRREEKRHAVRVVRHRCPDKFRWRWAVARVSAGVGKTAGLERSRLEEPVREMVLDLPDAVLQREVVLDARRHRVDLDRGEILPPTTRGDLHRVAFLTGVDVDAMRRYVVIPDDWGAPVETAGLVVVGRAFATHHRRRAHVAAADEARAFAELDQARRWTALSRALLDEG